MKLKVKKNVNLNAFGNTYLKLLDVNFCTFHPSKRKF